MPVQKFGRYETKLVLGSGGMARVYLARDTEIERDVAIKVLHSHLIGEADLGVETANKNIPLIRQNCHFVVHLFYES